MISQDKINFLSQVFKEKFGTAPTVISRAPGRLEILGNHTDYNQGIVLSVAVNQSMFIVAAPVPGRVCQIYDARSSQSAKFDLGELWPPAARHWSNYQKGLAYEMQQLGIKLPGFNAVMFSELPPSAGMSSSAALEISTVLVLRELAGVQDKLDWLDCAKLGQASECHYVGANTGLLDQISSLKGQDDSLIFTDFRTFDVQNIPMPKGSSFVVLNSMVKHNLANEYTERRQACEDAVKLIAASKPEVSALRDVSLELLNASKPLLSDVAYRRSLHVVGEIDRVTRGIEALERDDLATFGRLMNESQESSRVNFENSCPELDALATIGRELPGFYGARLSGGGFGGITVHLVKSDCAQSYLEECQKLYQAKTGTQISGMICRACAGAELQVL